MRGDTARALALKAALELRTGIDTPESVIARAEKFAAFIAPETDQPFRASPEGVRATQETASGGAPRRK